MQTNNDLHYFYLLGKDQLVESITEVASQSQSRVAEQKFKSHQQFEDLKVFCCQIPKDQACPYKIGDYLPACSMSRDYNCRMIKNKGKIPVLPRPNWNTREDKDLEAKFTHYLQTISAEKILKAKATLNSHQTNDEPAYRALYNSFKMYKVKDYTLDLAQELLNLVGETTEVDEHPYSVLAKLKANVFDSALISLFEQVCEIHFHLGRNHPDLWLEDMKTLFGAYHLFAKHLDFLIHFSDDLLASKGVFFNQGFLDWFEAGAMCAWEPLGLYRNRKNYKILELIKNNLKNN